MVVILVLLTFFAFIAVGVIRGRKGAQQLQSSKAEEQRIALGATYFHPGHAWATITSDDTVTVGVDTFTQKFIGKVDDIEIPEVGKALQQGEIAWKLKHGELELPQVSPVSGTIVEVNKKLSNDPALVNRSPYQKGWLLKIKASALREELKNLLPTSRAKEWMENVKSQLASYFAQEIGPVYQDGGELVDDIGSKLSAEEWKAIVHKFFIAV